MKRPLCGFTLVELLIGLLLLGVLLSAVVYLNIGAAGSAAALQTRNDLLPELQQAQNYMAGRLREAAYVFPPSDSIEMSVSGETTANKAASSQAWKADTHPFMAFVVPPREVVPGACALANVAAGKPDVHRFCYAFYAFYAMKRADYQAAVTGANRLPDDPANPETWVLMMYRGYYPGAGFSDSPAAVPKSNPGRLMMEYLPAYRGSTDAAATQALFSEVGATAGRASQVPGVTAVTLNLAAVQKMAGRTVRVPGSASTDFSSLTVYPRNVGRPALNN